MQIFKTMDRKGGFFNHIRKGNIFKGDYITIGQIKPESCAINRIMCMSNESDGTCPDLWDLMTHAPG